MKRITSYFDSTSKKAKPNLPLKADHNAINGPIVQVKLNFFVYKSLKLNLVNLYSQKIQMKQI